ncbi:MAG: GNAT family N-acetyltransferase [Chitinophagales bacterium]
MLQINFTPFPILTTDRLILRRITRDDAPEMFLMRSNPEVMKYINRPLQKSLEDTFQHIDMITKLLDENEGINWGITLKGSEKIVGSILVFSFKKEHYRAEIGYILMEEFHKKGIMHEAMQAVLKFAFETLQLHSLEANVNPDNFASIALLEKNDFIREAYFKEDFYWQGKFLDSAIYSLLAPAK